MGHIAQRITGGSKKSFGMYEKAIALEAAGADLIHLEFGRPCHDTPPAIVEAAVQAARDGHVHYSDMRGLGALRAAFANKLRDFNEIDVGDDQVLVTNGLTHASFAAIMATVDPGDEVILLEPYYPQHVGKVELAGGTVVLAPLDAADDFRIRADLIEPKISDRTKAIILINPCNPTGRVYSRGELEELAEIAIRHDLLVISDEVYEYITFGNARHISIASLPGMADRTISLFAFTKAYAMDGWRIGCAVATQPLVDAMLKITMNDVTHVNSFIQYGALEAVTGGTDAVAAMVADDMAKRDLVVSRLNQMPGVTCAAPEGTIYAFPDISAIGRPSQQLAEDILAEAHVVVEAGGFYGTAGDRHLRICFGSVSMARLDEAMTRLSRFFNGLSG
jgi:aspartate aminotransferase